MSKKQFYLLQAPIETRGTPWNPWYDCKFGTVIHAASEAEAREIANENAGAERHQGHSRPWFRDDVRVTVLDDSYAGEQVVIRDDHDA